MFAFIRAPHIRDFFIILQNFPKNTIKKIPTFSAGIFNCRLADYFYFKIIYIFY